MGTLADVIALDRADDTPVPDAMDAPTVAAEGRTYLPGCAAALGWAEGERLRLWVQAGHGVLSRGDGPGKALRLGTQHRLTLPGPARAALRTRVGEKLLALVLPGEDWVLLLSAAGAAEAARTLVPPAHVRRLLAATLFWFHLETGARRGGAMRLRLRDLRRDARAVAPFEKGDVERLQPCSEVLRAAAAAAAPRAAVGPRGVGAHARPAPHRHHADRANLRVDRGRAAVLFAGHADRQTTDSYDRADERELRAAVDA